MLTLRILLLTVLFAGCFGTPAPASGDPPAPQEEAQMAESLVDASPSPEDSVSTEDFTRSLTPSYSRDFVLSDCDGVVTEARYPADSVEMVEEPEWPPITTRQYDAITISAIECDRVKWGPFERPARFVLETNSPNAYSPETCHPDPETRPALVYLGMVASLGSDDPELVDYLAAAYGLPTYLANIERRMDEAAAVPEQVWTWRAPGEPASELRTPVDPLPSEERYPFDFRWYWFNESAVSAMDVHWAMVSPLWPKDAVEVHETATRATYGRLEEPMLAAGHPAYTGQGEYQASIEANGYIRKFTDHQCSEEVP